MLRNVSCKQLDSSFCFFLIEIQSVQAEEPLRDMELQEKEEKKIKNKPENCLESA